MDKIKYLEEKEVQHYWMWVSTIASILLSAMLWFGYANSPANDGTNLNIIFFVVSSIGVIAFSVIAYLICTYFKLQKSLSFLVPILLLSLIACISVIMALEYIYVERIYAINTSTLIGVAMPTALFLIVILLFARFFYDLLKTFQLKKQRIIMMILMSCIWWLCAWSPNVLGVTGGGTYHLTAYTNSIYNVLALAPYNGAITTSIYGHYALLIAPIAYILGGTTKAIYFCIACTSFLSMLFISCALNKIIKNDTIYFVVQLAMGYTTIVLYCSGSYFQVSPHRYIFACALIGYVACVHNKINRRVFELLGWIICSLSILWNTETGVVYSIAFAVYLCCCYIYENSFAVEKFVLLLLKVSLAIFMTFICAYFTVGIYNVLVGGRFGSILDFLYPMMSSLYIIEDLGLPVYNRTFLYVLIIATFLSGIILAIIRFFQTHTDETYHRLIALSAMVSVIGLGKFVYFINRAAYANISISCMEVTFLIGVLLDTMYFCKEKVSIKCNVKEILKEKTLVHALFILLFTIMSYFALCSISYIGLNFSNKTDAAWNYDESLDSMLTEIESVVPEGTYAFGGMAQDVYGYLGWKTGSYTIDFPDLNELAIEKINQDLMVEEYFFARVSYVEKIEEASNFILINEFNDSGVSFGYYKRVGSDYDNIYIVEGISSDHWASEEVVFYVQTGDAGTIVLETTMPFDVTEEQIGVVYIDDEAYIEYNFNNSEDGEMEICIQGLAENEVYLVKLQNEFSVITNDEDEQSLCFIINDIYGQ